MKITCFGSRGSLPSPSRAYDNFHTEEFGGNTTCYLIEAGPFTIKIDDGSGSAVLGNHLMKTKQFGPNGVNELDIINLCTHYHSDHIQGVGFHAPFYFGENCYHFHGPSPSNEAHNDYGINIVKQMLSQNQEAPYFPVPHRELPAKKHYKEHSAQFSEVFYYGHFKGDFTYIPEMKNYDITSEYEERNYIKITTIPLIHPNDCLGYLIEYCGKKLAFCTDCEPMRYPNAKIKKIWLGADILFMDGQYTEEQIAGMTQGFGHGTPKSCLEQAEATAIPKLVIIHHDPSHDDTTLTTMEQEIQAHLKEKTDYSYVESVEFAREGTAWQL